MSSSENLDSLPIVDLRPSSVRPKLAFLLHHQEMLYHFAPVLKLLDPAEVDLIRFEAGSGSELARKLAELPFACYDAEDLLEQGIGYQVLVTHHLHGPRRKVVTDADGRRELRCGMLIRMLGQRNVRFMYGMGSDHWNYSPWNELYDAFLCHGPMQSEQLAGFRGEKLLMGYPRYDAFFRQPCDRAGWLARLGCDPARPVVVWLPTLQSYYGTIPHFAAAVSRLGADYNVIVKPHPFSWLGETEYLAALAPYHYTQLVRESLDNLILFQLADYVLADYGGSAFSALYTDSRLILLDHPEHPGPLAAAARGRDSDHWLRGFIPHLGPEQAAQLPELLASQRLWSEQQRTRAWLQRQLFAPGYGYSAEIGAELLRRILTTDTPQGAGPELAALWARGSAA